MSVSLVYHGGALGDFLTALPAMAAWRRQHPGEHLVLLGKLAFAELTPHGLFDEVWDAESPRFAWVFGNAGDSRTTACLPMSSVSSALLFSSASSALSANLTRAGVHNVVRQDPFPATPVPIVDYHLSLFSGVTFSEEQRTPVIARRPASLPVPPHTAAVHPGSGSARKNWPLAKFVSLSRLLEARGFHVRWITGPAEETLALPAGASVWHDVPLPHLAAALSSSELYVGNDSGITHLAAAAGCATVALFGPTDPTVWAPRGRRVRVVVAPEKKLCLLDEETVFADCCWLLRR
ncbi:MAG TPA: glycosyltransferase family 9 protein [Spirochaetia bacterium]|nr:glycosyltransferase family 9 protein [Spirochaetia bacterium]